MRNYLIALLLSLLMEGNLSAAIMTFGDLSGNTGDLLTSYSEAGFTVSSVTGRWMEMTNSTPTPGVTGNPGPSIWEDTFTASLELVAESGELFTFSGVDIWGRTADYTIEGLLDDSVVFTVAANVPTDDWLTVVSPSTSAIDTLRISAVRDQAEYSNIDNINLGPVPEPSSLAILIGTAACFTVPSLRRICRRQSPELAKQPPAAGP